jgi:hypothetical protein
MTLGEARQRITELEAELTAARTALEQWRSAAVPTEQPGDPWPGKEGPRLALNAYGRLCYEAGRAAGEGRDRQ